MTMQDAPEIVEDLIRQAKSSRASDIHLQMVGQKIAVSFRLDGVMTPIATIDKDIAARVFGRIKFLASLKTYQDFLPQDGRIPGEKVSLDSDIRVATYPTVTGEKIVLRLFSDAREVTLDELGLYSEICEELRQFLRQSAGMLLLTGPAGSGKTTTIYACLRYLNSLGGRHIITVEDPVEQIIPGIMQTEVQVERGLSFAKAAKHLLRQDPQVLVIGEIRDKETANIAVRAAFTGHLLIATLHASSCRGVFRRMLDLCDDDFAVIASISLVLNQRLLRKICLKCQGMRCDRCLQTGYLGRVPIGEWILLDEAMRSRLRHEGVDCIEPRKDLRASARDLVAQKTTNQAELVRVFGDEIE